MTNRAWMRWAAAFVALAGAWPAVRAQMEIQKGSVVEGFKYPDLDKDGKLRSMVYGDKAQVLTENAIDITNLRLDIYSGTNVRMRVASPQCTFFPQQKKAASESRVRIMQENMVISGEGFSFESEPQRMQIDRDVKVVLKNVRKKGITGEKPQ